MDPSRVGGPENPLLNGSDLSTMIGPGTGAASFDGFGTAKYQNRRTVSIILLHASYNVQILMYIYFCTLLLDEQFRQSSGECVSRDQRYGGSH